MTSGEREIIENVVARLNSLGFKAVSTDYKIQLTEHTSSVADIVIFDENEAIYLIGEVKKELPKQLDRFHPAVDQGFTVAQTLKAKYFFIADASSIHWYEIKETDQGIQSVEIPNPPPLPKQPPAKPEIEYPGQISVSDWSEVIWKLADILRNTNMPRQEINTAILELLLIKQYSDEREVHNQFRVIPGEDEKETKDRIINIGHVASQSLGDVDIRYLNQIDASVIQTLVQVLQSYRFRPSERDKYHPPSFIPALLGTTEYEFATPAHVINLVSNLKEIRNARRILDPASGVGNFLIATALDKQNEKDGFLYVGVDINNQVSALSKMGFYIRGISGFHVINQDFLKEEIQEQLISLSPSKYDFIFCDPPMGKRSSGFGNWITDFFESPPPSNLTIEELFLIRVLNLLGENGTAAVLLPQGVLSLRSHRAFRKSLLKQANLLAIFDIPSNLFKYTQLQTHLLVFQAKRRISKPAPTLLMRLDIDDRAGEDEKANIITLATETYNYYRSTGKLRKEGRLRLSATVVKNFTDNEDVRMDFAAYAPEYVGLLDRLERGPFEVKRLSDIAEIKLGTHRKFNNEAGIPLLSVSNITPEGLLTEPVKYTTSETPSRSLLKSYDLLIGNIGRKYPVAIVPSDFPLAAADSSLFIIRVKPTALIQPDYLHFILNHEITRTQLDHLSTGATIRRISPALMGDVRIPILPLDKQRQIIEKVEKARNYRLLAMETEKDTNLIVSEALGLEDENGSQPEA